jgi:DNA repair exonuclease SbcCD ATPase subunit
MAEQKETIVLDFEVDEDEAIESINNLTKANKELRTERNALNLQSEQGKKRAQEINALIDQNTSKIKNNVSAIEKQKINIGNYKSALDGVHPALGKVGEGLEAGTSGLKSMTLQALRFIATPIGAILAALVAVFTLLKTALSQNDDLMDKFENVTHAVGVVLEVVISRVAKLGEALIKLASGDFTGAIDSAAEAFSGLGDEIANAVRQQQLFLDASRKLEDDTRILNIQIARTENELKKLDKESKNVNKTLDEQEDIIRRAAALQEELVRKKEDLARRDLLITARQLRAGKEFQQQQNENFDQYIQRLLDSSALGNEEKNKIAEKIIALENARGASLDDQAKRENALAVIQDKRTEALRKQTEELQKNSEAQRQARIAALEREQRGQRTDPLEDAFQTQVKIETDLTALMKEQLDQRQKDLDEFYKRDAAAKRKTAELKQDIDQATLDVTANVLGATASLFEQSSEQFKLSATAQTLISTYSAAQKSYESLSVIPITGPGLGAAAAAAAVIAGLARVAQINGIQFADGGWTGPGPKNKPAGIVHADEYVTPKRVTHMSEAQPHLAALERMRIRGYQDGGFVTDSLSAPVQQQLAIANVIKNMPPAEVSVVEIAKVDRRVKVKEKISRR